MIMILDVDVTAERRHYNTHRPRGDTTTLGPKGRQTLRTFGAKLRQPSPLNLLNPLNPLNPHAAGVSEAAKRPF